MGQTNYFLQTLQHLRSYEEVMLFINQWHFQEEEQEEAVKFLAKEYEEEKLNYPFQAPSFDQAAALWAAKTFYIASQLLLHRKNNVQELEVLLPEYQFGMNASAILSADLTLRFLPDILFQLKVINPEDPLIAVLENHLGNWHFSGIRYSLPVDKLDFTILDFSGCLQQLYVDRTIFYNNRLLALHSKLSMRVKASLGLYAAQWWPELTDTRTYEHELD